jgi:DNA-binding SARP family transcriptional activator
MTILDIRVLGAFEARIGLTPLPELGSGRMRALVTYLALEAGRAQLRSALAALFWPDLDEAAALRLLRQMLYRLATLLDVGGDLPTPLRIDRHSVQFDITRIRVDAQIIEAALARVRQHHHRSIAGCRECQALLDTAIGAWHGELLDGVIPVPGDRFDDWLMQRREHLTRAAAEIHAIRVSQAMRRRDYARSIEQCSIWLRIDPWNEHAHHQLVHALAQSGQRGAALRQLEVCRQMLMHEFRAEVSPALATLGMHIRQGMPSASPGGAPAATTCPGRDHERALLLGWLNQPLPCLICVSGLGGMGKSRLIAAIGDELHAMFDGRIVRVDCHDITQGEQLWQAIARQCSGHGIALVDTATAGAPQCWYDGLLMLDGLDPDLAPAIVQAVRSAAPWLSILTTQRQRLALAEAAQFGLEGLPPEVAVEVLRSRMAHDGMAGGISVEHCMALCAALDGMPLALELAAPLLRLYSCEELHHMIERGDLDAFTTAMIDVPSRQRSLTQIFADALASLDDTHHTAFTQLAHLAAPFHRQAAAAMLGGPLAVDVLRAASDRALLVAVAPGHHQMPRMVQRWLQAQPPPS